MQSQRDRQTKQKSDRGEMCRLALEQRRCLCPESGSLGSRGRESSRSRRRVPAALRGGSVGDRAAAVLEQVVPDFPDTSQATVACCTGVTLGLLAEWQSGRDPPAPGRLAAHAELPAGHWTGERANSG